MRKNEIEEFPEVWDELTQKDWNDVLKLRQRLIDEKKKVTINDVRRETARCFLLNRGIKTRYSNDKYFVLVSECAVTLDWLWMMDDDGLLTLTYKSTVNAMPKYGNLIGPMSHGADMTFGEFREALNLLKSYNDTQDENMLKAICGLSYRRKSNYKKTGYFRHPTTNETTDDYIRRGEGISSYARWGIMAWFAFFCEYLMSGDFIIDGNTVNFGCLFKKGDAKSKKNDIGMSSIAFTMAESHVFGDIKSVNETGVLQVMMKLLIDYNNIKIMKNDIQQR